MTLRNLAASAAQEQVRHNDEQRRIAREQRTASFTTEAIAWLTATFIAPDQFIVDESRVEDTGHVRWDDDWFAVTRNPFGLHPAEPCPTEAGAWHRVDASLFGVRGGQKLTTLEQVGRYLQWVTQAGQNGPSVGRCRPCDQAFGTETDHDGNLWVGVITRLGDLPRMAAEAAARNAVTG